MTGSIDSHGAAMPRLRMTEPTLKRVAASSYVTESFGTYVMLPRCSRHAAPLFRQYAINPNGNQQRHERNAQSSVVEESPYV